MRRRPSGVIRAFGHGHRPDISPICRTRLCCTGAVNFLFVAIQTMMGYRKKTFESEDLLSDASPVVQFFQIFAGCARRSRLAQDDAR